MSPSKIGANCAFASKSTPSGNSDSSSDITVELDKLACGKETELVSNEETAPAPPLDEKSQITISVKSITFNMGESHSVYIRKDYDTEVPIPEWSAEKEEISLAAYIIKDIPETINLRVEIEVKNVLKISSLRIKGVSQGKFGRSSELECKLSGETFEKEETHILTIPFEKHELVKNGVAKEKFSINWKYETNNEKIWLPIESTNHKIFMVLETPKLPWKPVATGGDQQPWATALDLACDWAKNKNDKVEVASTITKHVYEKLGLTYHIGGGRCYTKYNGIMLIYTFACTEFIKDLELNEDGMYVNCSDCATITSTFSNVLGCNLKQVIFGGREKGFGCNKIIAIGSTEFHYTFLNYYKNDLYKGELDEFHEIGKLDRERIEKESLNEEQVYEKYGDVEIIKRHYSRFGYHEIAFDGDTPIGISSQIYDACLQVRADAFPWIDEIPPTIGVIPTNMTFAMTDEFSFKELRKPLTDLKYYRERLVKNNKSDMINSKIKSSAIKENKPVM